MSRLRELSVRPEEMGIKIIVNMAVNVDRVHIFVKYVLKYSITVSLITKEIRSDAAGAV